MQADACDQPGGAPLWGPLGACVGPRWAQKGPDRPVWVWDPAGPVWGPEGPWVTRVGPLRTCVGPRWAQKGLRGMCGTLSALRDQCGALRGPGDPWGP